MQQTFCGALIGHGMLLAEKLFVVVVAIGTRTETPA